MLHFEIRPWIEPYSICNRSRWIFSSCTLDDHVYHRQDHHAICAQVSDAGFTATYNSKGPTLVPTLTPSSRHLHPGFLTGNPSVSTHYPTFEPFTFTETPSMSPVFEYLPADIRTWIGARQEEQDTGHIATRHPSYMPTAEGFCESAQVIRAFAGTLSDQRHPEVILKPFSIRTIVCGMCDVKCFLPEHADF